jgi:hypothetical protein
MGSVIFDHPYNGGYARSPWWGSAAVRDKPTGEGPGAKGGRLAS